MKRTDTVLKSITAFAIAAAITAGPAFGSTGHGSVNAALNEPAPSVTSGDFSSVNASVNEFTPSVTGGDFSSVNASVNEPTSITPVSAGSSVGSIVGSRQSTPVESPTVVREQSGFDWGDALIGAMGALTLALLSVATMHALRRRDHVGLGSQV